jgi:membrane-bound ClpP family serine protease
VWFGFVDGPGILILVALAGSIIGDLFLAFSFEAIAPVKVTVGPGERYKRTDDLKEMASVVSGFSGSAEGKVRVRGEIWAARHYEGRDISLDTGEMVKVIDREGLVLLIGDAQ